MGMIYVSLLLIALTYSETWNRTTANYQQPVTCSSFPCIINCDETNSCRDTTISCGIGNAVGGDRVCIINLKGTTSGYQSNILTELASDISINVDGSQGFRYGYLLANTSIGAKLYIDVNGAASFRETIVYAPYGVGSELSISCGTDTTDYSCYSSTIYDDYSTTVSLYSYSSWGFQYSTVSQQTGITKNNISSDPLYINYRAPVYLYCSTLDRQFQSFFYNTRDHGNWTIEGHGKWCFFNAVLRADHTFITNEEYYIIVRDGDDTTALGSFDLYASQNGAHIDILLSTQYATSHSDVKANYFFELICHRPDMILKSLKVVGNAYRTFIFSIWNISSNISGDVLFDMADQGACRRCKILINRIEGDATFTDTASRGFGFYGSVIDITHGVGGNVEFSDYSITNGQGFRGDLATCHIIIGDIGGMLTIMEHSEHGNAFYSQDWIIGTVGGNVVLQSYTDNGRSAFGYSSFIIEGIKNGNFQLISNSYTSFRNSIFTVNNGIEGDVTMLDVASGGLAFYDCFFNFYGTISGSFSVRDETINTGRSCHSTEWVFDNVMGDMEFVETSQRGASFLTNKFTIGYVGGNVRFAAETDNGYEAFDQSTYIIGTVNGNLTMYSNTVGAFSHSTVDIQQINGIATFIGAAVAGNDFYHTDFTINGSSQIIFDTIGTQAIRDSHNYFGPKVGSVQINIGGGTPYVLYSSIFDCAGCDSFTLNCLNDADCGGSSSATSTIIYCPQNNANNQCIIRCDDSAKCDYMDLFTTNGYCYDAKFECTNCVNNVAEPFGNGLSRIFCTTNGDTYGTNGNWYCSMKQDPLNNYQWYCDNYGGASCSTNICSDSPTTDPTNNPTNVPTKSPTNNPTNVPTKSPTNNPTKFGDTKYPTSDPSKSPTNIPSETPSKSPSNIPSQTPSTSPSNIPTNPTKYPTNIPTINPTNIPTINPSKNPTNIPSISPTNIPSAAVQPTNIPSKTPTYSPSESVKSTDNNVFHSITHFSGDLTTMFWIIVIGGALLLIVICLFIIVCKRNKRMKAEIKNEIHVQNVQMQSISSEEDGESKPITTAAVNNDTDNKVNDNNNNNESKQPKVIDENVIFGNDNALKMWLNNFGLVQYYDTFIKHGFNDQISSLSEITDQDLKEMGLTKIAHRRAILKQVKLLTIANDAEKEGPPNTNDGAVIKKNHSDSESNSEQLY